MTGPPFLQWTKVESRGNRRRDVKSQLVSSVHQNVLDDIPTPSTPSVGTSSGADTLQDYPRRRFGVDGGQNDGVPRSRPVNSSEDGTGDTERKIYERRQCFPGETTKTEGSREVKQ